LYDLIIFPSIWLEDVITDPKRRRKEPAEERLFEDGGLSEKTVDNFNDSIEYKKPQNREKPPPLR
jgi:hypothetical protein